MNFTFTTFKKLFGVNKFSSHDTEILSPNTLSSYSNVFTKSDKFLDEPYIELLKYVLKYGKERKDRTGTNTLSCFGQQLRFDISTSVPVLTTKKMAWRSCIIELLWFLRGETNVKTLQEQGVNIWNANTTREFLDKNDKPHIKEGEIGAGYGFQWRHFGGVYGKKSNFFETKYETECVNSLSENGFDQIKYIINEIKTNPMSRRIFLSAWNPLQLYDMALPPCHVSCQFYVEISDSGEPEFLSCHLYQRSVDCFLGLPFNIFSYTVLTYILAEICNLKPKELIISTGDTHIYSNHIEQVKVQIEREPYPSPQLKLNSSIKTKKIEEIIINDFELLNYQHHPKISGLMSA